MKRLESEIAPSLALFDLDGVLIQPGGYRHAVRDTINTFTERMGIGHLAPGEDEIALFEALGVTSEWDMVPLALALVLTSLAEAYPLQLFNLSEPVALPRVPPVAYRQKIQQLKAFLQPGVPPAEAVLEAVRRQQLFAGPGIAAALEELLAGTRSVRRSATTRLFQNLILGRQAFERVYGLEAEQDVPSYLETYDVPLIDSAQKKALQLRVARNELKAAVITARPSLPPAGSTALEAEYSPEAEMAAGLVGLEGWIILGYGKIAALAAQKGCDPESLLKPSPVQALAAMLAAWEGEELAALSQAHELAFARHRLPTPFPARLTGHIFEDSPIGIQSLQAAQKVLGRHGVELEVHAWGITQNADKRRALESLGAQVFPDINQALHAVFN